jgi:hypothetical protein
MTILANRSFIHLIIPENLFISILVRPIINFTNWEQNPFAYITTKRYMFKEFYSVIINTNAFKKFTIGYK